MIFSPTPVRGAFVVDIEPLTDDRGFFARAWCQTEARQAGIEATFVQTNLSFTGSAGTVRGLHYQQAPFGEGKMVRCIRGSVFDVIADVDPDSSTFGRWFGKELSAESRRALYLPPSCAHGYQTLTDETELLYHATVAYTPAAEAGMRCDDPFFSIRWPLPIAGLSEKDASWPAFACP